MGQTEPADSIGFRRAVVGTEIGTLRCMIRAGFESGLLLDAISRVGVGEGRRYAMVEVPGAARAFIKVYMPRRGHSLLRRMRPSRAIAEGGGYRAFARAGIETPQLLAWGEVRRRGLWMLGFVMTRMLEAPTAAEDFAARGDVLVIEQSAECLARIHGARLAHGDPRLRNFLISGGRAIPFDLCSWGGLTERRRRWDLVQFLGSAMTLVPSSAAETILNHYSARTGWRSPRQGALLEEAAEYARREGVA